MSSTAAPARNGSGGLADYDFSHGRELGAGNFGRTVLATHLPTGDLVAVKMIPRGERCDRNVEREVLNQVR
jgi:serine/threonine-protein kinase SRK2